MLSWLGMIIEIHHIEFPCWGFNFLRNRNAVLIIIQFFAVGHRKTNLTHFLYWREHELIHHTQAILRTFWQRQHRALTLIGKYQLCSVPSKISVAGSALIVLALIVKAEWLETIDIHQTVTGNHNFVRLE